MAKRPPPLKFKSSEEIRDWRRKHQMNQAEFWSRVGVTQSGGSRYEAGRTIPKSVQTLLTVTYGTDQQLEKMNEALRDWPKPFPPSRFAIHLIVGFTYCNRLSATKSRSSSRRRCHSGYGFAPKSAGQPTLAIR